MLSSVLVFIDAIPKEEHVQWETHNARQLILQDHWTMARSAQQQCYEVVVVKNTLPTTLGRLPTRKEISDKLRRNIKLADGRQEDYSENCVKDAVTIYERILTVPSLAHIIVEPEKRDGHSTVEQHRQAGCVGIKDCRAREIKGSWAHWGAIILTTIT